MSNNYQLTKKIHTLAQEKAKKHGLRLNIGAIFYIDLEAEKRTLEILEKRCDEKRTIENSLYAENQRLRIENYKLNPDYFDQRITTTQIREILWVFRDALGKTQKLSLTPKSRVKGLDDKWLGASEDEQGNYQLPLFTREPRTVLTELLQILESI